HGGSRLLPCAGSRDGDILGARHSCESRFFRQGLRTAARCTLEGPGAGGCRGISAVGKGMVGACCSGARGRNAPVPGASPEAPPAAGRQERCRAPTCRCRLHQAPTADEGAASYFLRRAGASDCPTIEPLKGKVLMAQGPKDSVAPRSNVLFVCVGNSCRSHRTSTRARSDCLQEPFLFVEVGRLLKLGVPVKVVLYSELRSLLLQKCVDHYPGRTRLLWIELEGRNPIQGTITVMFA